VALTEVNVCNRALGRLGASGITALADGSTEAAQCTLHYAETRDALLREHPWRFAVKWVVLVQDEEADSGTSNDDNTATTLNDTDQEWEEDEYDGFYIWLSGGTGANQIREIDSNSETEITVTVAWTTTPDTTSMYEIWENYPPYPWDYQYDLPSDFLRFVKTDDKDDRLEIVGTLLKTDEDAITMQYVWQNTDPDTFDPLFVEYLVVSLAVKLCMPLMQDKHLHEQLLLEQQSVRARARLANLQEAKTVPTGETWNESRF